MYHEEFERPRFRQRFGSVLDKAESIYLRILRALILIIASLLLAYAGWLAVQSLYKISRSPSSVQEEVAAVAADEITSADMPTEAKMASEDGKAVVNPAHQQFYTNFVKRYYGLFSRRFEPFRQAEDKKLTSEEFDDSFINSAERLDAVTNGQLDFEGDKADLEALLVVMTEAADKPVTQQRLKQYKAAKKVAVSRKVQKTRTTYRSGWDSNSTACQGWFYSPVGCAVTRPVQTPYTETVTTMEFPEGTQSHSQIFRAFQDRYFTLLDERRQANANRAESERQDIIAGNEEGKSALITALQIVGGFLILMFFFLLIAIERHQRKLAAQARLEEVLAPPAEAVAV
jgi:hypothetical protein